MDMPFYRMAEAVDALAAQSEEEVIVQTGHTDYDYRHAKAFKFCTKEEMRAYLEKASVLILQGGWGAISEASSYPGTTRRNIYTTSFNW